MSRDPSTSGVSLSDDSSVGANGTEFVHLEMINSNCAQALR